MQPMIPTPNYGLAPAQLAGLMAMQGMPHRYAEGGAIKKYGLASAAEQLRSKGRDGDTILAHINPQEAGILKLLGGSGTINPYTGLPEYRFLGSLGGAISDVWGGVKDIGSAIDDKIFQPVLGLANDIAEGLGPIGQIAAAYFGGPIGAAIYGGFAAPGDKFNVGNAAKAGLVTYGLGSLGGGDSSLMGGDFGGGAGAGTPSFDYAGEFGSDPFGLSGAGAPSVLPDVQLQNIPAAAASTNLPPPISYDGSGIGEPMGQYAQGPTTSDVATVDVTGAPITDASVPFDPAAYSAISTGQGVADLASAAGKTAINAAKNVTLKDLKDVAGLASLGMTAYGGYKSLEEQKKMKEEAERARAAAEKKRAEQEAFAQSVMRDNPLAYRRLSAEDVRAMGMAMGGAVAKPYDDGQGEIDEYGMGGIAGYAKGGMPPRFLSGGGDGMSDSIHANIDGQQPARLADGEFVVPADVVSHIGNGSSKAGAKKLYAMMDRVRDARTGKKRQAPQINANRMMPA